MSNFGHDPSSTSRTAARYTGADDPPVTLEEWMAGIAEEDRVFQALEKHLKPFNGIKQMPYLSIKTDYNTEMLRQHSLLLRTCEQVKAAFPPAQGIYLFSEEQQSLREINWRNFDKKMVEWKETIQDIDGWIAGNVLEEQENFYFLSRDTTIRHLLEELAGRHRTAYEHDMAVFQRLLRSTTPQ